MVQRKREGHDDLLPLVERAVKRHGLGATAFGFMYFNDPTLVFKMRKGRRLYGLRTEMERVLRELGVVELDA